MLEFSLFPKAMLSEFLILDQEFHFPYRARPEKGNVGFIDIDTNPERIGELPERHGYPDLDKILLLIRETEFRSLRIDSRKDAHILPGYNHSDYSSVTFVFRTPLKNDLDWFRFFFDDLNEVAKRKKVSDQTRSIFTVSTIKFGAFTGLCVDIRMFGDGFTAAEAKDNLIVGLRLLLESFRRWDQLVRNREDTDLGPA